MASRGDVFAQTGPTYLTAVDWQNSDHRRSIAASLVEGVYQIEHDRQQNRKGPHALAPPWWEFFGFKLVDELVDILSVFGALFKYDCPYPHWNNPGGPKPPQYVMAFRGTINTFSFREQDLNLNLRCAMNDLKGRRRVRIAMEKTGNIISHAGPENVWLAGHSLGSSIALLIGRHMAKESGYYLESYLFNPPYISTPLELLKNEKLKSGLRLANRVLMAGIVAAVGTGAKNQRAQDNPFVGLHLWVPNLFVNPNDPICCEYVGYFENREKMETLGLGSIERKASKYSAVSLISGHVRGTESEALHKIPSANLTTNISQKRKRKLLGFNIGSVYKQLKEDHAIQQWWRLDLELECKLYRYKSMKQQVLGD